MVAYNFQKKFADDVRTGKKNMTIRRTRRANVGNGIKLYTGQRTKKCELLREAKVMRVDSVTLTPAGPFFGNPEQWPKDKHEFAAMDGFKSYGDMLKWFDQQYCLSAQGEMFSGYITVWA